MSVLAAAVPPSFVATGIRAVIATRTAEAVRTALELDPDIAIVADCNCAAQAETAIRNLIPDLLVSRSRKRRLSAPEEDRPGYVCSPVTSVIYDMGVSDS